MYALQPKGLSLDISFFNPNIYSFGVILNLSLNLLEGSISADVAQNKNSLLKPDSAMPSFQAL
jgi:hypothetical protein